MKRSSLFMIELLAMVLVFAICATVCLSIIGKSRDISHESQRLTQAVYLAETVAANLQNGTPLSQKEKDGYTISVQENPVENGLVRAEIVIQYQEEHLYSLIVTYKGALS